MNILSRFGSAIKDFGYRIEQKFSSSAPGSIASIIGSIAGGLRRTSAENDPLGAFAGWVYFAIDRIGDAATRANPLLYRLKNKSGDVELVDDHELLSLLERPNPYMTRSQFIYTLTVYTKIFGEAPVWKERSGKKIVRLWPLRPDMLRKQGGKWLYTVQGKVMEFSLEDVGLPRKINPSNTERGYGALSACSLEVDTDSAAAIWNKYFMQNQGRPDIVLETEQKLDNDTVERLRTAWSERYSGPTNAGKPLVLDKGLKAKPFDANSPKEAGYMETRNFSRDVILGILGIPESMFSKDSTYANSEAGRREFAEFTVDPIMRIIFDWLSMEVVPAFDDDLWLTYDGIVPEDTKQLIELAKAGNNQFMTVNETRFKFNLPPIHGGDVIYLPLSMQPAIGEKSSGQGMVKLSGLKTTQSPKMQEIKRRILARSYRKRALVNGIARHISKRLNVTKVKSIRIESPKQEDEAAGLPGYIVSERKAYLQRTESREKVYASVLRQMFTDQEVAVRQSIALLGIPKGAKEEKSVQDWVNKVLEVVNDLALVKIIRSQAQIDFQNGVVAIAAMLGRESVDITSSEAAVSYIQKTALDIAKNITDTTKDMLSSEISAGIEAGEGMEEISARVASVFEESRSYRSERIARTEVGRAENFARNEEMRALGATKRMWLAVFRNTREDHAAANGQVVGIDEKFSVGGYSCQHPHDTVLPADQSVNCQCSVSPVVD